MTTPSGGARTATAKLPRSASRRRGHKASREKWKIDVGTGYAAPLVVGDAVYTFTRQGETEVLAALDAATGRIIWRTLYSAPLRQLL